MALCICIDNKCVYIAGLSSGNDELPRAKEVVRPDGQGLKYHECYKLKEDDGKKASHGQKKRMRARRARWEAVFAEAKLYMVQTSDSKAVVGKLAPWFCLEKDMNPRRDEVLCSYGDGAARNLRDMKNLQDLKFDPKKGVVVCVEGWHYPLFEVSGL